MKNQNVLRVKVYNIKIKIIVPVTSSSAIFSFLHLAEGARHGTLLAQFSQAFCHSKYLCKRPVLKHRQSLYFHQRQRPGFIPTETARTIMEYRILIFTFLDTRRKINDITGVHGALTCAVVFRIVICVCKRFWRPDLYF
jgi:hypothetical protein